MVLTGTQDNAVVNTQSVGYGIIGFICVVCENLSQLYKTPTDYVMTIC